MKNASSRGLQATLALSAALVLAVCGNGDPADPGQAPASHTVRRGSAWHAPGLNDPEQSCISCHGADLRGAGQAPSCYRCHGQKWS
jgi:mono/diheme cytochrome c family protein